MQKTTQKINTSRWHSVLYGAMIILFLGSFTTKESKDINTIETNASTNLPIGSTIALRSSNNKYISSENGKKPIISNRREIGEWEKFIVVNAGNGRIALKANNGKYVSSEDGKAPMTANRNQIGSWEKFKVISAGNGRIALKANNDKYVSSEDGKSPMKANRSRRGSWEKFKVYILADNSCHVNPGTIKNTQVNCGGFQPEEFIGTAATSNHEGTIQYQWQIKTTTTWQNINNANTINYQPAYINSGSVWYRRGARKNGCNSYAYSNSIDIHVKPAPEPDVTINNSDCEKENGEITFNFQDYRNRSHIGFSIDGGVSYINVKDNEGSFTFKNLTSGNYNIWTRWGNRECPIDLGIVTIEQKSITVSAGNDQEICEGEEVVLTATVDGNTDCIDCLEYDIKNTNYCKGNQNYVMWLSNGYYARWFSNVDLKWEELPNGTAKLTGTVFDYTSTQSTYEVEAIYAGKTTTAPQSSPKNHECNQEDSADWVYYTQLSGTITKTDGSETFTISRRGPAFQIGNGANSTEKENSKLGASGWFTTSHHEYSKGDFNIILGDCINSQDTATSFLWSTGETTETITVNPTEDTIYTVKATNCEDCSAEDTVKVFISTPEVTVEDQEICKGSSTTLTAVGEGTVLWSTGDTTQSIDVTPTETTTYTVTLTNDQGCTATTEAVVIVKTASVTAGPSTITICLGEEVSLTASPADSYMWSTGETTQTITVSPTEDAWIELKAIIDGCPAQDVVEILVSTLEVTVEDQEICKGESVVLTATATGQSECTDCTGYGIENTDLCDGYQNYVLWLNRGRYFSNVDLEWTELADGTATLIGTILETTNTQTTYEVDVTFTGRTTNTPADSPREHSCNTENTNGWVYYTEFAGTITRTDGTWSTNITKKGSAFQIGNGANNFEREQGKYGGSGWFDTTDPDDYVGDFNINLVDCINTPENQVSYLWSTGETTQSITVSPEVNTTYTVTVTGCDTCEAKSDVNVIIKDSPEVSIEDQEICWGSTTTLTATGEGTVVWSTGETTPSIEVSPTETTTYTVTLTNDQGCTATDEAVVTVKTVSVTAGPSTMTICLGEEVTLTATPADSYAWSTGETTQTITVSPTEDAWIELKAIIDGCPAQDVVEILVSTPEVTVDDQEICWGSSTTLTAVGEGTVVWSTGETTASIEVAPTNTTTYTVTLTNNQGCTVTDEAVVTVKTVSVTAGPSTMTICLGEEVTLTATPADSYAWSTGETTQTITVSPTEDAWIELKAIIDGCPAQDVVEILVNAPAVDAGSDQNIIFGNTVTLTAVGEGTVEWSTGETTQSIDIAPTETTTYTVTLTNDQGCTITDTVTVTVEIDPCLSQEYLISATPIPVENTGIMTIDIAVDQDQDISYEIYKMDGNRIGPLVNVHLEKGCSTFTIDLGTHCVLQPSTNYILIITGNGWSESIQFITK